MALTNLQLEERIIVIEALLTEIQTALNAIVPKKTINAAIALKQQEIEALKARVTILESQVAVLQSV